MSNIYDKASLVLIPSGTKTSKVYSQKPTNGDGDFTFSRSTAATRVNASGNIEKETQNLLKQSNAFNVTANWTNGGSDYTITSGQSGYDGSSDAWLISKASTANNYISQGNISASGVNTTSVYAKAGTADGLMLYTAVGYARWNLSTGVQINLGGAPIDTNIESIGSGWYRCSVTTNGSIPSVLIKPVNSSGVDVAGTIYIQDAQLEQGLVARDYIETTTTAVEGGITDNVPRLDYTDSSCPALLLEPQRTNLIDNTEYFAGYDLLGNVSLTTNYGISPEGKQNASRITGLNGAGTNDVRKQLSLNCANKTLSFSVYLKGSGTLRQQISNGVDQAHTQTITLTSEWKRHTLTGTFNSTAVSTTYLVLDDLGATATEYEIWGTQCEEGSYATSYIPTYGSAVTRNGDNYLLDNMATNGITNDSAISFFIDTEAAVDTANTYIDLFALKLSSGENLRIESRTNDRFYVQCSSGFVNSGDSPNSYNTAAFAPSAGRAKILFTMTSAQLKLYYNGNLLETWDGSYNIDFNQFRSDVSQATAQLKNNINQALILSSAISNQEAIDLTTL